MANEYVFDPTGTLPANRITDEQIIVLAPGDRKFHFTMPRWAPFFEDGLLVKLKDINNVTTTLVMGVDYYLSHKYADASLATMHPVWGSITFLDRTIVGTVIVSYNTLGGVWTIESNEIANILLNTAVNPRITTWENVTNRPVDFPVINHPWNLDDMIGQKEILDELESFHDDWLTTIGINTGGAAILNNHINDFNNPHKLSAGQTGAYSKTEINTILNNYVTVTGTAADSAKFNNKTYQQVFTDVINTKVNNAFHADNADNATQANNSNELNGKTLNQIMIDVGNSTVDNSNKFNGKTYQELLNDVSVDVGSNITNALTLQNKTLNDIMADVIASTVDNSNNFNGMSYIDVKNDILSGTSNHSLNSEKLEGLTLAEIISQINSQLNTNALTLEDKTLAEILDSVIHVKVNNAFNADNAYLFNGLSQAQLLNLASQMDSDNSKKFDGMTVHDYLEYIDFNNGYSGYFYYVDNIDQLVSSGGSFIYFELAKIEIPFDENDEKLVNQKNLYSYNCSINIKYHADVQVSASIDLLLQFKLNETGPILDNYKCSIGNGFNYESDTIEVGYILTTETINSINYNKYKIYLRFKRYYFNSTNRILIINKVSLKLNALITPQDDSSWVIFDNLNPNATNIVLFNKESLLDNYYQKTQVYTKAEVDAQLQQVIDDLTAYINSL